MKKKILITILVILVAVIAILIYLMPSAPDVEMPAPQNNTAEEKIEYALEGENFEYFYTLIYSGSEEEPTSEEFAESLTALSAIFHFGEDVTVKKDGDDYIATDIKGNALRFAPKENGKYEISVENTVISAYTVYAPLGSKVTLGDKELDYNEAGKNYYIFGIEKGEKKLTVEKEGCVSYEATVNIGIDTESKVNLNFTENYLEEYKKEAYNGIKALMTDCAKGNSDLSAYNFKADLEKKTLQNALDKIVFGIDTERKITIGNIRFIGFLGEKVSQYDENAGNCVAKFQYEYTYPTTAPDGSTQMKSDINTALVVMEKIKGVWYLESADFTLEYTL